MFNEKNKEKTCELNTDGYPFISLKDIADEAKMIRPFGFIFTKGRYGKGVAVALNDCFVSLPSWAVETFEEFSSDEIAAVKDGCMVLCDIKPMVTKNGKTVFFKYDDYDKEKHRKAWTTVLDRCDMIVEGLEQAEQAEQ